MKLIFPNKYVNSFDRNNSKGPIYLFSDYLTMTSLLFLGCPFIPEILDIIMPLNETREKIPPFETNYGVDSQEYFNWIFLHGVIVTFVTISWIWTMDVFVFIMVQHCCGLFDSVG